MANKINILLGYSEWTRINESSQPDAVYFTVDLKDTVDFEELIVNSIKLTLQPLSDVCTLKDVNSDSFIIELNEEDSFDIFSEVGATDPLKIQTAARHYNRLKHSEILGMFSSQFPKINDLNANSAIFALGEKDRSLSDEDLLERVISSDQFIRKVNGSFFTSLSLSDAEEFLRNKQNVEKAFLEYDAKERKKFSTLLSQSLQKKIFYEVCVLTLKRAMPFPREEVNLTQLKSQIEAEVNSLKQRAKELDSDTTSQFVKDLIDFQKKLVSSTSSSDIRRRLASSAIVQTYDLLGELGITADQILKYL